MEKPNMGNPKVFGVREGFSEQAMPKLCLKDEHGLAR